MDNPFDFSMGVVSAGEQKCTGDPKGPKQGLFRDGCLVAEQARALRGNKEENR